MDGNGTQNARNFVRFKGALSTVPNEIDELSIDVARLNLTKGSSSATEIHGD